MMGPSWVPDTFAGIMLVVAAVSAARLSVVAATRRWLATDADADGAHLLMAVAMAGMLTASLKTLPAGVWEPVFGTLTVWFAGRVAVQTRGQGPLGWARNCHAPHLVHSVAMLYMFLALRTATGGGEGLGGMSAAGGRVLAVPTLALMLALVLAGYAVRDLDRFTAPAFGWLAAPARAGAAVPAQTGEGGAVSLTSTVSWPPFSQKNLASRPAASASGRTLSGAAEWVPACCRIVMSVTMAYMLIIMI